MDKTRRNSTFEMLVALLPVKVYIGRIMLAFMHLNQLERKREPFLKQLRHKLHYPNPMVLASLPICKFCSAETIICINPYREAQALNSGGPLSVSTSTLSDYYPPKGFYLETVSETLNCA